MGSKDDSLRQKLYDTANLLYSFILWMKKKFKEILIIVNVNVLKELKSTKVFQIKMKIKRRPSAFDLAFESLIKFF